MSGLPGGAVYFMCCVLFLVAPSLLWLMWVWNMIPTVRETILNRTLKSAEQLFVLECPVLALGLQCCCQHWAGKVIHTQQAGGVPAKTVWGWGEKDDFYFLKAAENYSTEEVAC